MKEGEGVRGGGESGKKGVGRREGRLEGGGRVRQELQLVEAGKDGKVGVEVGERRCVYQWKVW